MYTSELDWYMADVGSVRCQSISGPLLLVKGSSHAAIYKHEINLPLE